MRKILLFKIKTLSLCTIVLILSSSAFAQTKKAVSPKKPIDTKITVEIPKPSERPVKVILREGEPVNGTFVNATSEGVQIVIAGNTLTVKWDVISQVVFTDTQKIETAVKTDNKAEKQNEAIRNALKSLRKLTAATEVGVNFQEYGRRLIDVKTELGEYLPEIPDGYIKNEINAAMEAYTDAGTAWNGFIQGTERYINVYPFTPSGKALLEKYSIDYKSVGNNKNLVVSVIWAKAKEHLENAGKGQNPNFQRLDVQGKTITENK